MWISNRVGSMLDDANQKLVVLQIALSAAGEKNEMLQARVAEMRAEANWFKHRLTQVERERAQLIASAIGIKIAVPEFVPTYEDPGSALNEMPNLSSVGGDAADDMLPDAMNPGIDYSMMPGYSRGK